MNGSMTDPTSRSSVAHHQHFDERAEVQNGRDLASKSYVQEVDNNVYDTQRSPMGKLTARGE